MQIASFSPYIRPVLELVAVASLCGWASCLALGLSFFTPLRAILVGFGGVVAGAVIWRLFGLPPGPALEEVPLIPTAVGTVAVAFLSEVIREARVAATELKAPERRQVSGLDPASEPAEGSERSRSRPSPGDPASGRNPSLEAR